MLNSPSDWSGKNCLKNRWASTMLTSYLSPVYAFCLDDFTRECCLVVHQSCNKQERTDICTFIRYIYTCITFCNLFLIPHNSSLILEPLGIICSYVLLCSLVCHLIMFYFVISKIFLPTVYRFVIMFTSMSL